MAGAAAEQLKHTLLMFDDFHDVAEKAKAGNAKAKAVMQSWADAEWFNLTRPEVAKKITVTVFKVPGETNTDDLSPAPDAWSRPDIPLHALAMLKNDALRRGLQARGRRQARPDAVHRRPEEEGPPRWPTSATWSAPVPRANPPPTRCCGSWATTSRSCRTSAAAAWLLGGKIAPIFFNTMEDAGALPIEVDVLQAEHGRRDRRLPV